MQFEKLRLKNGAPLWLINAPQHIVDLFAHSPADALHTTIPGKKKPLSQLLLFVYDSGQLAQYIEALSGYVVPETLFWICYPKQTGAIKSDLIHMAPWRILPEAGFRGQTSISIDDDWSGMRFTNAPAKKPSQYAIPAEDRKVEGIDFVNRTVKLPADAQKAADKHGLGKFFYKQSFTCQKEHAMAIADAKKPETRQRRIDKMIEMLEQKMLEKQAKSAGAKRR